MTTVGKKGWEEHVPKSDRVTHLGSYKNEGFQEDIDSIYTGR
jgi:hypothetical protein